MRSWAADGWTVVPGLQEEEEGGGGGRLQGGVSPALRVDSRAVLCCGRTREGGQEDSSGLLEDDQLAASRVSSSLSPQPAQASHPTLLSPLTSLPPQSSLTCVSALHLSHHPPLSSLSSQPRPLRCLLAPTERCSSQDTRWTTACDATARPSLTAVFPPEFFRPIPSSSSP